MSMTDTGLQQIDAVDVYKKWRQSSGEGGFISFQYWHRVEKVIIDIGTTNADGGLKDNAKCYVDVHQFLAYLQADVFGYLARYNPDFGTKGFAVFGGSKDGGKTIARVFSVNIWSADKVLDRRFKCGWYNGTAAAQGAILPNYNEKIKEESIKMSQAELGDLYQRLTKTVQAFAVRKVLHPEATNG
jgi:hypothetical protein